MNLALVFRKFILTQRVVIANTALDTITFTIRGTDDAQAEAEGKVNGRWKKRMIKQTNEKEIYLTDGVNNRKQRNGFVLEWNMHL